MHSWKLLGFKRHFRHYFSFLYNTVFTSDKVCGEYELCLVNCKLKYIWLQLWMYQFISSIRYIPYQVSVFLQLPFVIFKKVMQNEYWYDNFFLNFRNMNDNSRYFDVLNCYWHKISNLLIIFAVKIASKTTFFI